MYLKSCPPLMRSELRVDPGGVHTSSQQRCLCVSQQGALRRTCTSNHGNTGSGRLPLSIISPNTLRCSGVMASLKVSSGGPLQLLPSPPGFENEAPYQTVTEDGDAPLDIWAVIKPGHVREKIAIFASDGGGVGAVICKEHPAAVTSGGRDRTPQAVCGSHAPSSGLSRAAKAKGGWEEISSAKRRRRSASSHNQNLQQDTRVHRPAQRRSDATLRSGVGGGGRAGGEEEEEELTVSVVEMVAFLEQRASEQQPDVKPLLTLQRSSTTITLSRAPPPHARQGAEEEEPESVRVSDMVAKLESECLRRRAEGDLSRSNSLRRTAGRVLLVDSSSASSSSAPSSSSQPSSSSSSLSQSGALSGAQDPGPVRGSAFQAQPRPPNEATPTPPHASRSLPERDAAVEAEQAGAQTHSSQSETELTQTAAPPLTAPLTSAQQPEGAEPLPGLLFLSPPPAASNQLPHAHVTTPSFSLDTPTDSHHCPSMNFDLCLTSDAVAVGCQPLPPPPRPRCDSGSPTETLSGGDEQDEASGGAAVVPLARRLSVSKDFLEMRQRLQQLLDPQPYLSVLPHHLLLKIFLLLPTRSLAALKCTCHYFRFIMETYAVRPADSLWVSDPRYRDDPCKQCKKRYGRGDVSLCRWHHKPYCQALPYGPGYWMCCHGAHRDTPGCNVGLHDNRWVPAFHSINVPICRRNKDN